MTSGDSGRTREPNRSSAVDEHIVLPESTLCRYPRFSLYNSPYPAHDGGNAIDLYPETNEGLSPIAGEILETRTVRAPPKSYADAEEYLILIDVDCERSGIQLGGDGIDNPGAEGTDRRPELVARVLHVRPTVEPGDQVAVGDSLGPMIRSGFFAPWVANHVHVGFRRADQNLHRAGGSLPVTPDVSVEPLSWDGAGTVTETGETYALLDAPAHPNPREVFAGIAGVVGEPTDVAREEGANSENGNEQPELRGTPVALDGGLAHYARGGAASSSTRLRDRTPRPVSFLDHHIGDASGRTVTWRDIDVVANGDRITGLSLFSAYDPEFGAKLVCPGHAFEVGDRVEVTIRESDDPVRLG